MKQHETNMPLTSVTLKGVVTIPKNAVGLVIFSQGSGSSRLSRRNQYVAELIQVRNIGTLLFDLLTEEEDLEPENRFDIALLTQRLIETTQWVQTQEFGRNIPIAYFGASTGAASALGAASYFGQTIRAIVCRGGRPDLAMNVLSTITTPTLFIVGGWDHEVIELNEIAYDKLNGIKQIEIVPEASHLFEEPGKIEEVANLAISWYERYLIQ